MLLASVKYQGSGSALVLVSVRCKVPPIVEADATFVPATGTGTQRRSKRSFPTHASSREIEAGLRT